MPDNSVPDIHPPDLFLFLTLFLMPDNSVPDIHPPDLFLFLVLLPDFVSVSDFVSDAG
jgi:hypothetical protein